MIYSTINVNVTEIESITSVTGSNDCDASLVVNVLEDEKQVNIEVSEYLNVDGLGNLDVISVIERLEDLELKSENFVCSIKLDW